MIYIFLSMLVNSNIAFGHSEYHVSVCTTKICRISNKPTWHKYRPCISQQNSITKTDEFDGSRILLASEQNAMWTQVTMDYVVTVAVSNRLRNLAHVVTKTADRQKNINSKRHKIMNIKNEDHNFCFHSGSLT